MLRRTFLIGASAVAVAPVAAKIALLEKRTVTPAQWAEAPRILREVRGLQVAAGLNKAPIEFGIATSDVSRGTIVRVGCVPCGIGIWDCPPDWCGVLLRPGELFRLDGNSPERFDAHVTVILREAKRWWAEDFDWCDGRVASHRVAQLSL